MSNAEQEAILQRGMACWAHEKVDAAALDRVLAGALARVEPQVPWTARLRWVGHLTRAQLPIISQRLAAASLLVIMLGAAVALAAGRGWPRDVFVSLAPVAAAAGSALVFSDELGELSLVMRASPRLVMLARLTVVFAVDLAAGLLASVAVAGRVHETLTALIGAWLGPMLLLAAVSLLVSVLTGPGMGITAALGLWFVHVLAGLSFLTPSVTAHIDAVWTTSTAVLVVAAVLTAAAVAAAPRRWVLAW